MAQVTTPLTPAGLAPLTNYPFSPKYVPFESICGTLQTKHETRNTKHALIELGSMSVKNLEGLKYKF